MTDFIDVYKRQKQNNPHSAGYHQQTNHIDTAAQDLHYLIQDKTRCHNSEKKQRYQDAWGCLAGSVYAAAVILPVDFKNELLNDSKQLTEDVYKRQAPAPTVEKDGSRNPPGISLVTNFPSSTL